MQLKLMNAKATHIPHLDTHYYDVKKRNTEPKEILPLALLKSAHIWKPVWFPNVKFDPHFTMVK